MTKPVPRSPEFPSAKSPLARSATTPNIASLSFLENDISSLELPHSYQSASSTNTVQKGETNPSTRPIYTFQRNFTWPPALSVCNTDIQFGMVVEWLQKCAAVSPLDDAKPNVRTVRLSVSHDNDSSAFGEVEVSQGQSCRDESLISSRFSIEEKKQSFRSAVRRRWNYFLGISKEKPCRKFVSDSKYNELERGRSKKATLKDHATSSHKPKSTKRSSSTDASKSHRGKRSSHKHNNTNVKLPPHELSLSHIHRGRLHSRARPVFTAEGEILLGGEGPLWEAHGAHHRRSRTLSGHRHLWREVDSRLFTIHEERSKPRVGIVPEHIGHSWEEDGGRLHLVEGMLDPVALAMEQIRRLKELRTPYACAPSPMVSKSVAPPLEATSDEMNG